MTHSATPGSGPAGAGPAVSLVVVNARVWTGRPGRPWADGLAVRGDRLAAVGSSAEIRKLAGPAARVVDARGGFVMAGGGDVADRRDAPGGDGAALAVAPAATSPVGRVLAAGAPADFVVFDRDPSGVPPVPPPGARVVLGVAGGEVVVDLEP